MALYAILDLDQSFESIPPLLSKAADRFKDDFEYLIPPMSLGTITVKNLIEARSPDEHGEKVWAWARSVWNAWTPQHHLVMELFNKTKALI